MLSDSVQTTTEYPLDTEQLGKGSIVPHEDLERATGIKQSDDPEAYRLAVLGIRNYIERRLKDRGIVATIVTSKSSGLRILTDEEAVAYNAKQDENLVRKRVRTYRRILGINRGLLSTASQSKLDRTMTVIGRRIQADQLAKRDDFPELPPVKRATPGLLKR